MLFYKKYILLSLFLVVMSCTNLTLYNTKTITNLSSINITVGEIDGEVGFYLRQNLSLSFNSTNSNKTNILTSNLHLTSKEYALSSSNQATRKDLIGTLDCELKNNDNKFSFKIRERVSYDINQSNPANKAAEQNAKKRLANLLSKRVLNELYHSNLTWLK